LSDRCLSIVARCIALHCPTLSHDYGTRLIWTGFSFVLERFTCAGCNLWVNTFHVRQCWWRIGFSIWFLNSNGILLVLLLYSSDAYRTSCIWWVLMSIPNGQTVFVVRV
jgi:hypothetical protein